MTRNLTVICYIAMLILGDIAHAQHEPTVPSRRYLGRVAEFWIHEAIKRAMRSRDDDLVSVLRRLGRANGSSEVKDGAFDEMADAIAKAVMLRPQFREVKYWCRKDSQHLLVVVVSEEPTALKMYVVLQDRAKSSWKLLSSSSINN